jgi:hypothetical protein
MRLAISGVIAGLLCFSTYVSAQQNKEKYELQERCGRLAAEVLIVPMQSMIFPA